MMMTDLTIIEFKWFILPTKTNFRLKINLRSVKEAVDTQYKKKSSHQEPLHLLAATQILF